MQGHVDITHELCATHLPIHLQKPRMLHVRDGGVAPPYLHPRAPQSHTYTCTDQLATCRMHLQTHSTRQLHSSKPSPQPAHSPFALQVSNFMLCLTVLPESFSRIPQSTCVLSTPGTNQTCNDLNHSICNPHPKIATQSSSHLLPPQRTPFKSITFPPALFPSKPTCTTPLALLLSKHS